MMDAERSRAGDPPSEADTEASVAKLIFDD